MHRPRASAHLAPTLAGGEAGGVVRQAAGKLYRSLNHDDDETYDEAVKLAANVCGTPAAMLSFVDRGRQWFSARIGLDAVECPRALFFCSQAIRMPDQVMVVPDVAEHPRFARNRGKGAVVPFRFYAGAPLVAPLGTPFGTISVIDRNSRGLTELQATGLKGLARQIVRQLALGQENIALRAANARLAEISMTDALTCIANRRGFNERLDAEEICARQTGKAFSLLLMDVDQFKLFNDRHGHVAGDEALFRIAQILKANNRSYDLLARYGGEEFALILPHTRLAAAAAAAERIRGAVEKADMPCQGVTLSIGVATYDPARGAAGLMADADKALYAAKAGGRNRIIVATNESLP